MKKVMLVFGTRPEAIKMCPLVKEFQSFIGIDHNLPSVLADGTADDVVFVVLGALVGATQEFLNATKSVDKVLLHYAGLSGHGLAVIGAKVFIKHLQEFPYCHCTQGTGEVKSVCHSLSRT